MKPNALPIVAASLTVAQSRTLRYIRVLSGIAGHQREGETVVAFGADGLNHRRAYPRFGSEQLSEPAHGLNIGVGAGAIGQSAIAHHVIGDNETAAPRQFQRPAKIFRR